MLKRILVFSSKDVKRIKAFEEFFSLTDPSFLDLAKSIEIVKSHCTDHDLKIVILF